MITIWHNPRCRKSRETLALIESANVVFSVRRYLEDVPTVAEITEVLIQLGFEDPRGLMRRGEAIYKDLNLKAEMDSSVLVNAMAENPILIERPVVTNGKIACLGRPPEAVKRLL